MKYRLQFHKTASLKPRNFSICSVPDRNWSLMLRTVQNGKTTWQKNQHIFCATLLYRNIMMRAGERANLVHNVFILYRPVWVVQREYIDLVKRFLSRFFSFHVL